MGHLGLTKAWCFFTSNNVWAEVARFAVVGVLGCWWMFFVMWLIIDVAKLQVSWWFVDTWKFAYIMGAVVGFFHNFFLNKLLGGLSRIGGEG